MADLNIVNVSDIKGRTTSANVQTTVTNIVTNTFGQSKVFKINNILLSNRSANSVGANVNFVDYSTSNTTFPLIFNVEIPIRSTIEVLSKSIYLEEGDRISANTSSDSNNIVITISYEELS
jgi:hypothetical protein